MIRTQVYLPDFIAQRIRAVAATSQKSQAEVIREALQQGLRAIQKGKEGSADGLLALAELGRKLGVKGPADLSANIDKYLYEK